MKKILAILLTWMLVLPGFAVAADDVALPRVPASGNVTLPASLPENQTRHPFLTP